MWSLSMAANIIASSTGGVLWGSDQAGVSFLAAVCWWAITFNWSKCICGIFVSGRILTCSRGTNVIVVCFVDDERDDVMEDLISYMVSIGI